MMIQEKTAANSKDAESEERLDALATILAEGFLQLAMTGQIDEILKDETVKTGQAGDLIDGRKECNVSERP